jgi:hypothetical protein
MGDAMKLLSKWGPLPWAIAGLVAVFWLLSKGMI